MRKFLCKIFGHKWNYKVFTKVCNRCSKFENIQVKECFNTRLFSETEIAYQKAKQFLEYKHEGCLDIPLVEESKKPREWYIEMDKCSGAFMYRVFPLVNSGTGFIHFHGSVPDVNKLIKVREVLE